MFLLFYIPVSVLSARETVVNKTHKNLYICESYIVVEDIENGGYK